MPHEVWPMRRVSPGRSVWGCHMERGEVVPWVLVRVMGLRAPVMVKRMGAVVEQATPRRVDSIAGVFGALPRMMLAARNERRSAAPLGGIARWV